MLILSSRTIISITIISITIGTIPIFFITDQKSLRICRVSQLPPATANKLMKMLFRLTVIIALVGMGVAHAAPQPPTHYGKQAFPPRIWKHR